MFEGIIARIAASVVGGYVKKGVGLLAGIPRPVWEAAAVIGYVLAFIALHQSYAHAQLRAADKAGYERRSAEDAKALALLRSRAALAEAAAASYANQLRERHEQETHANAAAAAALLVRGPGAAGCRPVSHPALPAASSGRVEAGGKADAAVARLPDDQGPELLGMPFDAAVAFAREHDDYRSEVKAWHEWYPHMVEWAERLRQPLASGPK